MPDTLSTQANVLSTQPYILEIEFKLHSVTHIYYLCDKDAYKL
jgi:hypothetical protein